MPLADDIEAIRNRALSELTAAHDYYADTKHAWDVVNEFIAARQRFSITNLVTGSVTTEAALSGKIRGYVTDQLAEATFQTFLAVFESFFVDFLRTWLRAFPHNLMPTEPVDFPTIFNAADKSAIIESVIDRKIHGLVYKKPADWFKFVHEKLQFDCPTSDEIAQFAEAKATRDVLSHNRGIANEIYLGKAGVLARFASGERVDVPDPYHREMWNLLRKIIADLADAMITKFP